MTTVQSNEIVGLGVQRIITLSASTTLTASMSGSTIGINSATAAVALTLPAVATSAGFKYRIYWKTAGNSSTLAGPANTLLGAIINQTTTTAVNGSTTITFVSGTAPTGSYVDAFCDGVKWQVLGISGATGGLTVA